MKPPVISVPGQDGQSASDGSSQDTELLSAITLATQHWKDLLERYAQKKSRKALMQIAHGFAERVQRQSPEELSRVVSSLSDAQVRASQDSTSEGSSNAVVSVFMVLHEIAVTCHYRACQSNYEHQWLSFVRSQGAMNVLRLLAESSHRTNRELSDLMKVTPSRISQILAELRRANLVQFNQTGQTKNYELTELGQSCWSQLSGQPDLDETEVDVSAEEVSHEEEARGVPVLGGGVGPTAGSRPAAISAGAESNWRSTSQVISFFRGFLNRHNQKDPVAGPVADRSNKMWQTIPHLEAASLAERKSLYRAAEELHVIEDLQFDKFDLSNIRDITLEVKREASRASLSQGGRINDGDSFEMIELAENGDEQEPAEPEALFSFEPIRKLQVTR